MKEEGKRKKKGKKYKFEEESTVGHFSSGEINRRYARHDEGTHKGCPYKCNDDVV